MNLRHRTLLALVSLPAISCEQRVLPPAGQVLLYVDTDAPVPPAADTPASEVTTVALFDTVRIEVYADGVKVANGDMDFPLTSDLFANEQVSIGIVPAAQGEGGSFTARVRLFLRSALSDGEPPPSMTLDTTVALGTIPASGIVPLTVMLRVKDLGSPLGSQSSPTEPIAGAPSQSLVGTWSGGVVTPCTAAVRDGEACVSGGAFWFGSPALEGRTAHNDIYQQRLVALSPYILSQHEVTVAEFRAAWPALAGATAPTAWTGPDDLSDSSNWCTWVAAPTGDDVTGQLPLNCVTWETARAYCQSQGADLPSEAQYEYVASGSGRGWSFPWGFDPPACGEAIWGQAGVGAEANYTGDCRAPGTSGWMDAPGHGSLDRVGGSVRRTGDASFVVDLGGNLAEWALDRWSRADEAYWSAVRVFTNPVADLLSPGDGDERPVRGGSWLEPATETAAAIRNFNAPTVEGVGRSVGFRCARAGT